MGTSDPAPLTPAVITRGDAVGSCTDLEPGVELADSGAQFHACTRKREKNSPCQRKADDARENSFSETRKKNPRNDPLQKQRTHAEFRFKIL